MRKFNLRATIQRVVKSEFDASVADPPIMVHEVKKLNKMEKIKTMVLPVAQDKFVMFATLICNSR